jgi:hypothetical protein
VFAISASDRLERFYGQPRPKTRDAQMGSEPFWLTGTPKFDQFGPFFSMLSQTFLLCAQTLAMGGIDIPKITIQATNILCTLSAHNFWKHRFARPFIAAWV